MTIQNKLSLTKKLDGGYLHIKKSPQKINVKKGGYSDYLHKQSMPSVNNNMQGGSKKKDKHRKIVSVHLKSPKKKISPQKHKKEIQKIPDIIPQRFNKEPDKLKVEQPKKNLKRNQPLQDKGIPIENPKVKGSLKKNRIVKRDLGKSKGRRLNKSLTKRRNHSLKKGKRISVTKSRKYSNKEISKIQSKLNEIKKKSNQEIKKELEKQGVTISGKSPGIMKDVYMYSQLCGINIKRE